MAARRKYFNSLDGWQQFPAPWPGRPKRIRAAKATKGKGPASLQTPGCEKMKSGISPLLDGSQNLAGREHRTLLVEFQLDHFGKGWGCHCNSRTIARDINHSQLATLL